MSLQEPQSPNAQSGNELAVPVSLDAQNELRTTLRAKLRRGRKGGMLDDGSSKSGKKGRAKKGEVSSDKGPQDGAPAAKRKRGTCESEPAASSLPKAKAKPKSKAKAKAKALPSEEKAKPKAKAKAKSAAKAKAKSGRKGNGIDSGVTLRLKPDPNRSGYSECGTLLLGCSSCRWGPLGCGTCLRTNFHGLRWNRVACGE